MPPDDALDILQVGTRDIAGGAEKVAWDLFRTYRSLGHGSWLAVGYKHSNDCAVSCIPNERAPRARARFFWGMHHRLQPYYGRLPGIRSLCHLAHWLAEPGSALDAYRGREDFHYPGTSRLGAVTPRPPDILHCHNLHGGYFDLRVLPALSHRLPVVMTLHDAWLLTGHCAHSFDCDRWRRGCGHCPDLTIYPRIRRDATAFNWRRKRDICLRSRLHVATPCRWLMERVRDSMLAPAIEDARIIPYGIDLSVFHPADKRAAREALGIPQEANVLLFAANGIRRNIWKDYRTMREAVMRVAHRRPGRELLFIALGESAPGERTGDALVRFVPYTSDAGMVARYYHAADIYVHAARIETFPNAILEALACGTPVVATAVGGIPEQIVGFGMSLGGRSGGSTRHTAERATGVLVPVGDAAAMAAAMERLIGDDRLRRRLGANAADDARRRFDLQREAADYLGWYAELVQRDMSHRLPHLPRRWATRRFDVSTF